MGASIILPAYNEVAYVERALQAVLAQNNVGKMEILVADGMSTDGTRQIVERIAREHPQANIRIVDNPGKIVATGMNLAMSNAKGEIIIRVDGHCVIAPDYVRKCVEHIEKDGVDGVGGPMASIGETSVARITAIAMSSPFGVGNSAFRTTTGQTMLADTVPFPAYTREIIEQAGLYDEELVRNQDDEYNYRIRELGGKILLADDVRSTYYSRGSLAKLWKQFYQYGFYKVRVLQKHPRQMQVRQFVPPAFVAGLVGSLVIGLLWPAAMGLFWVVAGSYVAANVGASVVTAARRGWKSLPLLPLTFAILHVSYGLGFLVGLARFWNRWGDRVGKVPEWSYGGS